MPRHSNKDLTAERKELAALLDPEDGESLVQALARHEAATLKRVEKMEGILKMQAEAIIAMEEQRDAATVAAVAESMNAEPGLKPSMSAPADFAHYPKPGEAPRIPVQIPPDGGPPQSPVLGDMTPGYPEWVLVNKGADAVREKWAGRLHLLPLQIQSALK